MARIEFKGVEQKMDDLRGYCVTTCNPDKNPYRASELTDDEFNFVSGMNYVLSYLTDNFLNGHSEVFDDEAAVLRKLKKQIASQAIKEFARSGYYDLEMIMTSFIDGHDEE